MMFTLYDKEVDVCSSLTSTEDSTCPAAGNYAISSSEYTIPEAKNKFMKKIGFGVTVPITITFDFGETSTQCTVNVKLNEQGSSGMTYSVAAGAIVVLGLATAYGIRRRRMIGSRIDLLSEEEKAQGDDNKAVSHFEMMPRDAASQMA